MIMPSEKKFRGILKKVFFQPLVLFSGLASFCLILFVLVPALTFAPTPPAWVPDPVARWSYDMRLLIGRPITTLSSLSRAIAGNPEISINQNGQPVSFLSGDLTIQGSLFGVEDNGSKKPAILLLHGSTPRGRDLGIYRLLADKLAARDVIVLTIDLRGFGQSDDPADLNDPASFDFVEDVEVALTYLQGISAVKPDSIHLVGHSLGADVALTAVAESNLNVKSLILIGPGRRFIERGGTPGAPEFDYFKRREMRYMQLDQEITDDVFLAYRTKMPLENHIDFLSKSDHVPVLLIDGGLENTNDLQFLQNVHTATAPKTSYVTLEMADHYVNIAGIGPVIIFDENAVEQLVQAIVTFIGR